MVVDVLGHLLGVRVTSAQIHDGSVGGPLIKQTLWQHPSLEAFLADGTYGGVCRKYVEGTLGLPLHISRKVVDGFAVLPKRWIVERFLAWLGNNRRLSKDYECCPRTSESFIQLAAVRIVLRRLTV